MESKTDLLNIWFCWSSTIPSHNHDPAFHNGYDEEGFTLDLLLDWATSQARRERHRRKSSCHYFYFIFIYH